MHCDRLNRKLDRFLQKQSKHSTLPRQDGKHHQFYTRVKNLTNIKLNAEKLQLLKYGLNYSTERPASSYAANLVAETEQAIRILDVKLQNTDRFMATKKLKQIINPTSQTNVLQKRQLHVMKELNKKLTTENAIVTQADKGKTIVITDSKEYSKKVHSFLIASNSNMLTIEPTNKFQKLINKTMQECNLIIDKRQIKFLTQKKASPPTLKAQLQLHKTDIPIRPVINNRTAPACKLAKQLSKILNQYISLNNHYTVTNSTKIANDLTKLQIHVNRRMITLDIKDIYVNIPIDETLDIIRARLLQNNDAQITHQIFSLLRQSYQNYFTSQQNIYQPNQGMSMGSPISSLIAKIFLQQYEETNIKQLLNTKNLAFYMRYVDDILIIFDTTKINLHTINTYISNLHNNIKLNPTYEEHSSIDFLDLTISREHKKT
jgi:hypothetical protein